MAKWVSTLSLSLSCSCWLLKFTECDDDDDDQRTRPAETIHINNVHTVHDSNYISIDGTYATAIYMRRAPNSLMIMMYVMFNSVQQSHTSSQDLDYGTIEDETKITIYE